MKIAILSLLLLAVVVSKTYAESECLSERACGYNLQPVCGSDGKTYSNLCLLEAYQEDCDSSVHKVKDGCCRPDDLDCQ